ncbi:FAD-dependent oxidoreductase [Streptomyces lavendulocolor]|uniref:FAD-dependent oxidoreductase n=1 Tax=Streptomyces lavendulocolor TaxID=67316 RepID=UPI0033C167EA
MGSADSDADLGMGQRITRRDFLDGIAVAAGALTAAAISGGPAIGGSAHAAGHDEGLYPPSLTGLRGSHEGSFEVAHALRDGTFWPDAGRAGKTGEQYDLVVVGAGISGLSAAHFYLRDIDPSARILLLDPHADFGGHATRNEFEIAGRTLIGYGGSQSIDTPSAYPAEAVQLLHDVGIDVDKFRTYFDRGFYRRHGASEQGVFFTAEEWGRDHLAVGRTGTDLFTTAPLDTASRSKLIELFDGSVDYLVGVPHVEKLQRLRHMSYGTFLRDLAGLSGDAQRYMIGFPLSGTGVNADQFPALDAAALGYPGTDGLSLDRSGPPWEGLTNTAHRFWGHDDPYIYHFPDGNASIARSLVRRLIPAALPGRTMEDLVTARCDYSRLDCDNSRVRIRLNTTVVRVEHHNESMVDVTYVSDGRLRQIRAGAVVLACWNAMIPHIAPDLTPAQHQAAHQAVKYPVLYANVALTHWRPWARLGVNSLTFPGEFWANASLDYPVSMGAYRFSASPDDPILIHLEAIPTEPGMSPQDGAKAGRRTLHNTTFTDLERSIRRVLARALGSTGFDPAADIAAITVNRWAHGYARYYGLPFDAAFWPAGPTPAQILGTPVGRITIASTDLANHGFIDGAIETAHRAITHFKQTR